MEQKDLAENSVVRLNYTGELFKNGAKKVYAHCGYNEKWDNLRDIEMTRTDSGFCVDLNIEEGDTFNICFKSENDEWDNNKQQNYVYKIKKVECLNITNMEYPIKKQFIGDYCFREASSNVEKRLERLKKLGLKWDI